MNESPALFKTLVRLLLRGHCRIFLDIQIMVILEGGEHISRHVRLHLDPGK